MDGFDFEFYSLTSEMNDFSDATFFDNIPSSLLGEIMGSMYHRDAHDQPGGLYYDGPGTQDDGQFADAHTLLSDMLGVPSAIQFLDALTFADSWARENLEFRPAPGQSQEEIIQDTAFQIATAIVYNDESAIEFYFGTPSIFIQIFRAMSGNSGGGNDSTSTIVGGGIRG